MSNIETIAKIFKVIYNWSTEKEIDVGIETHIRADVIRIVMRTPMSHDTIQRFISKELFTGDEPDTALIGTILSGMYADMQEQKKNII